MSDEVVIDVPPAFAKNAIIDERRYKELRADSTSDPLSFWREAGKRLDWITPYSKLKDVSFDEKDLHIRWYYDGALNASYNCLDRHLAKRGNQIAIIWEGDDPKDTKNITYNELHEAVCRLGNVLKSLGVTKGDRVCIYMPMII